jgi:hypothetical protein
MAIVFVVPKMRAEGYPSPGGGAETGSQIGELAGEIGFFREISAGLQIAIGLADALLLKPSFGE